MMAERISRKHAGPTRVRVTHDTSMTSALYYSAIGTGDNDTRSVTQY